MEAVADSGEVWLPRRAAPYAAMCFSLYFRFLIPVQGCVSDAGAGKINAFSIRDLLDDLFAILRAFFKLWCITCIAHSFVIALADPKPQSWHVI